MKKVGIVSCYFQHNYGSMLQALATQMALEKLGIENETIDIEGFRSEIKKAKIKYFAKASLTSDILLSKMGMAMTVLRKKVIKDEYSLKSKERSKIIRNWVIFAAVVLSIYGCQKSKEARANNIETIKRVTTQYPEGATLIDATKEGGSVTDVGKMWLDLDGDTNTTEALITGYIDKSMERRLWEENKIGDKRPVADWAARVERPRIRVVPGKERE